MNNYNNIQNNINNNTYNNNNINTYNNNNINNNNINNNNINSNTLNNQLFDNQLSNNDSNISIVLRFPHRYGIIPLENNNMSFKYTSYNKYCSLCLETYD
jgi:hypothetical protein